MAAKAGKVKKNKGFVVWVKCLNCGERKRIYLEAALEEYNDSCSTHLSICCDGCGNTVEYQSYTKVDDISKPAKKARREKGAKR